MVEIELIHRLIIGWNDIPMDGNEVINKRDQENAEYIIWENGFQKLHVPILKRAIWLDITFAKKPRFYRIWCLIGHIPKVMLWYSTDNYGCDQAI